jgi:hypothetical protein
MTSQDWTLLVIAANGGRPIEPVQLQKSLFLIGRNVPLKRLGVAEFYQFSPYDYGPFCSKVYEDAEQLERDGLVYIARPPFTRFNMYSPTDRGIARAKALRSALPASTSEYLQKVVAWTTELTFNQLVSSIYDAFPEMRANSVFQG